MINYRFTEAARLVWKNGCSSCRKKNFNSEVSSTTREIGENSKEKRTKVVEVRRVKCRQPIGEYSNGSFLSLKVLDRCLQIKEKVEIEGYLVKDYKRVGL